MITFSEKNVAIFDYFFAQEKHDFASWLRGYLADGILHPFVMEGREEYDLGDLLDTIVPNFPRQVPRITQALVENLQLAAPSMDLHSISTIAYAAARSTFTPIAGELAHSIDRILEAIERTIKPQQERFPEFVIHLDSIVASLSGLALKTEDLRVNDTCRRLFYNPELALFSSTLFAPVAIADLNNWPQHWAHVIEMATTPMILVPGAPEESPIFSPVPEGEPRRAHFNVKRVFENFLAKALEAGISIERIGSAGMEHYSVHSQCIDFAFSMARIGDEYGQPVIGTKEEQDEEMRYIVFVQSAWLKQQGLPHCPGSMVTRYSKARFRAVWPQLGEHPPSVGDTRKLKQELIAAAVP